MVESETRCRIVCNDKDIGEWTKEEVRDSTRNRVGPGREVIERLFIISQKNGNTSSQRIRNFGKSTEEVEVSKV